MSYALNHVLFESFSKVKTTRDLIQENHGVNYVLNHVLFESFSKVKISRDLLLVNHGGELRVKSRVI